MQSGRRDFIRKMGLGAGSIGILPVLPENLINGTQFLDKEDEILVSKNHAVAGTTYGKVRGYSSNGVYVFKGIHYGATTAGENRFKPPVKPAPWEGVKNALVYGPVCPQQPNDGWESEEYAFLFQWNDGYQSEDCLRVNVWTPAIKDNKKRPVMFWMHGGAFFSGSSQEHPSYDGENLSRKGDVVVVSVNHRLNVFGFLNLAEYGDEYKSSANVGMLDLVAALEWVRDNIANFGGDPGNVTIFGQSGGGAKVTGLMGMPSAKGLFHKAISQSSSTIKISTHEYSSRLARLVLDELKINSANIKEIHKLPFQKLTEAAIAAEKKLGDKPDDIGRAGWQPVVDGIIFPGHPFFPSVPEFSAHIPMVIGSNRNEWSASIGNPAVEGLDEAGFKKKLNEKYGKKSDDFYRVIRKVYPDIKPVEILSFLNPYNIMAYRQAEKMAEKGGKVFLYLFAWNTPLLDGRPRAFHCSEIPFVFNNTNKCATMTGGGDEAEKLADKISQAWINFAYTGNPNQKDFVKWPEFTARNGEIMIFDNISAVKNDKEKEFRNALENI